MMGLSNPIHIVFLGIILLLVFGAKRLPEVGRSLGSGLRGFKESISDEHEPRDAQGSQQADNATPPVVVATPAVEHPHIGAPVAAPAPEQPRQAA